MQSVSLGFIGAGNMARSLIGGLVANAYDVSRIWVADRNAHKREDMQTRFGIHTTDDIAQVVREVDVLVLTVKPNAVRDVLLPLQAQFAQRAPLLISVAAGVRTHALQQCLGATYPVVRCMPNTPALVGAGATGLFATTDVSETQRNVAESLLRSVGVTHWVSEEGDLDTVTALSGSGPAYFYLLMEALQNAGMALGFDEAQARLLVVQTALGAARLALESDNSLTELREFVTSKGGTTEAALNVLQAAKVPEHVVEAVQAARDRAQSLAEEFES